ncbi:MAG: hypothetical protein IPM24_28500 [Bryobacterales bacterium]|nr:hypothetical protein [Bryobacterales bacterium]
MPAITFQFRDAAGVADVRLQNHGRALLEDLLKPHLVKMRSPVAIGMCVFLANSAISRH